MLVSASRRAARMSRNVEVRITARWIGRAPVPPGCVLPDTTMRYSKTLLRPWLMLAVVALLSLPAGAAAPLPDEARAALAKATRYLRSVSAEGGYLWWYSEDLK